MNASEARCGMSTNLENLRAAENEAELLQQPNEDFLNVFLGALSLSVLSDVWNGALETALNVMRKRAAGEE
ncbi:MAG TPA: hypothetical protein VFB79_18710 [Candidatus Angelobacter sp.]|nr:hypothetical protein [Candidatus Angelobacter sp.]